MPQRAELDQNRAEGKNGTNHRQQKPEQLAQDYGYEYF
jgi:hypothetical protein